jgi:hypothetical protein
LDERYEDDLEESHRMDPMDQRDPPTPNDAMKALAELFSSPRVRAHAHFRYRIDGPTEVEKAFDSACKEVFGRDWDKADKEHKRWVRRLRRLGLIGPA